MDKKKKILELIRIAEGGMKTHFISLCTGLNKAGYNVIALCDTDEEERRFLIKSGVKVYPFRLTGNMSFINDIKKIIKVWKIIRKEKVDLVHCHGLKAGITGRMAALFAGVPCIYTVHNFALDNGNIICRYFIRKTEKMFSLFTSRIITVSEALKKHMSNRAGISGDKIYVIHNGIKIDKFLHNNSDNDNYVKEKYNIEGKIIIGTVARLIPSKGIQYLLKAIPLLNEQRQDLVFFIIGKGPYEQKLKEISKELDVEDNVIFTGHVDNIEDFYKAFDIFVLPTLSEGLGISLLEAMASQTPVIATETGGIPEIIKNRENGILVRPRSSDDIADAVQFLLDNPDLVKEYATRAYNDVHMFFSESAMIHNTCQIIDSIV